MCQLCDIDDTAVATGRHWTLPLQCVWSLLQAERHAPTNGQATQANGECRVVAYIFIIRDAAMDGERNSSPW